jgi:hypothetical protein
MIIVADVNHLLHFRMFDDHGEMLMDTDETRLTERAGRIEDFRKQFDRLWPRHPLTRSEKARVITAVRSIAGPAFGPVPRIALYNRWKGSIHTFTWGAGIAAMKANRR